MLSLRLKPASYVADPDMDQLRTRADDLSRARDWAGLLALRPELEQDGEFWLDLWGPWCAIAARQVGDLGAMDLLSDLVRGGFGQLALFEGQLEAAFAGDPRWPALLERITRNVPAAPLVLTDWPVLTPAAPLQLLDLPGRAEELRALVPPSGRHRVADGRRRAGLGHPPMAAR
jgi:hypothetical protein